MKSRYTPGFFESQDGAVPGTDQRAGTVHDLLQDGIEVEVFVDAEDGLGQSRMRRDSERLILRPQAVAFPQPVTSSVGTHRPECFADSSVEVYHSSGSVWPHRSREAVGPKKPDVAGRWSALRPGSQSIRSKPV